MRIKVTDNRPPEIILKEEKIRISSIDDFNCNDYIDQVKDNVSTEKIQVGCSSELDASLEEQDILYTAVDKYGNTGYAKMTIKIVGNENEMKYDFLACFKYPSIEYKDGSVKVLDPGTTDVTKILTDKEDYQLISIK